MKMFIVVVIILSLCLAFAGCTKTMTSEEAFKQIESMNEVIHSEIEENDISTKSEEFDLGHADLSIPDAKEYDEITWPTFGIATKIPMPTWSDRGCFYGSSTDEFMLWAEIGYTTLDDYNEYVELCKASGFNKGIQEEPGSSFTAYNEEGYLIDLLYVSWSKYLDIQVTY